uniref:SWIM-type domain-containing protein n=1 Tax=Toxoplasma gondii COUG TaxID=1074873 RepID=A0A2G8Y4U8_TOXGO|nr:hypothetical protein TGCOUG_304720 [Toxoplasma gondii COUG]
MSHPPHGQAFGGPRPPAPQGYAAQPPPPREGFGQSHPHSSGFPPTIHLSQPRHPHLARHHHHHYHWGLQRGRPPRGPRPGQNTFPVLPNVSECSGASSISIPSPPSSHCSPAPPRYASHTPSCSSSPGTAASQTFALPASLGARKQPEAGMPPATSSPPRPPPPVSRSRSPRGGGESSTRATALVATVSAFLESEKRREARTTQAPGRLVGAPPSRTAGCPLRPGGPRARDGEKVPSPGAEKEVVVVDDSDEESGQTKERFRGNRSQGGGRGRGERTSSHHSHQALGERRESEKVAAVHRSHWLLQSGELRWEGVHEFRSLARKRLHQGVLSKAQKIAEMEDGVRATEEDEMTFVVYSDSSNCRFVDLAVCECSCPNHEPPCSHLTAVALAGSSQDRLQFALMTLMKLRFLNPFADRNMSFVALSSSRSDTVSFEAILKFVRSHFSRRHSPEEVAEAAVRAAVGLLLRFYQRAQGTLPPLPSTVQRAKEREKARGSENSDDEVEEETPKKDGEEREGDRQENEGSLSTSDSPAGEDSETARSASSAESLSGEGEAASGDSRRKRGKKATERLKGNDARRPDTWDSQLARAVAKAARKLLASSSAASLYALSEVQSQETGTVASAEGEAVTRGEAERPGSEATAGTVEVEAGASLLPPSTSGSWSSRLALWCQFEQAVQTRLQKSLKREPQLDPTSGLSSSTLAPSASPPLLCLGRFLQTLALETARDARSGEVLTPAEAQTTDKGCREACDKDEAAEESEETHPSPEGQDADSAASPFSSSSASAVSLTKGKGKGLTPADASRLLSLIFCGASTEYVRKGRDDAEAGGEDGSLEWTDRACAATARKEGEAPTTLERYERGDLSPLEGGVGSGKKREDFFCSSVPAGWADRGSEAKKATVQAPPPGSVPCGTSGEAEKQDLLLSILSEIQKMRNERKSGFSWSVDGALETAVRETEPGEEGERTAPRPQRGRRRQAGDRLRDIVECLAALETRVVAKRGASFQQDNEEETESAETRDRESPAPGVPRRDTEGQGSFLKCLLSLPEAIEALGTALAGAERPAGNGEKGIGRTGRRRGVTDDSDSGLEVESAEEGLKRLGEQRNRSWTGSNSESGGEGGESGRFSEAKALSREAIEDEERRQVHVSDETAILTFFLAEAFPALFTETPEVEASGHEANAASSASSRSPLRPTDAPPSKHDRLRVYRRLCELHFSGATLPSFASYPSPRPSHASWRLWLPSLRQAARVAALGRKTLGLSPVSLGEDSASDADSSEDEAGDHETPSLSVEGQARLRDLYGASVLPAVSLLSLSSLGAIPQVGDVSIASPTPDSDVLSCLASTLPSAAAVAPSSLGADLAPEQIVWLIATAPPLVDLNFFLSWEATFAPHHGSLLSFLRRHLHSPLAASSPAYPNSSFCTLSTSSFFLLLNPQTLVRLPRHNAASSFSSPPTWSPADGTDLPQAGLQATVAALLQSIGRRCGRETAVSFLSLLCLERTTRPACAASTVRAISGDTALRSQIQRHFWGDLNSASEERNAENKQDQSDVQTVAAFVAHFLLSLPVFSWIQGIETVVSPLAARVGRRHLLQEMERFAYDSWFSNCLAPTSTSSASHAALPSSSLSPLALPPFVPATSAPRCPGSSASSESPSRMSAGCGEARQNLHLSQAQSAALEKVLALCRDVLTAEQDALCETEGEVKRGDGFQKTLLERHVWTQLESPKAPGSEGRIAEMLSVGAVTGLSSAPGLHAGERQTSSHLAPAEPKVSAGPESGRASPDLQAVHGAPAQAPHEALLSPRSPTFEAHGEELGLGGRRSSSEEEEFLLSQPLLHLRRPRRAGAKREEGKSVGEEGNETRLEMTVALRGAVSLSREAHGSGKAEEGASEAGEAQRLSLEGVPHICEKRELKRDGEDNQSTCLYARQRAIIEAIRREEFGVGLQLSGAAAGSIGDTRHSDCASEEAHLSPEEREARRKERETNALVEDVLLRQRQRLTRALDRLSRGLYTADSHLQMELLQNADDNNYSELQTQSKLKANGDLDAPSAPGRSLTRLEPWLHFEITPQGLAAFNNENGFTEKDVRALCDVARSTKEKREGARKAEMSAEAGAEDDGEKENVRKIGRFGLGFKSVFSISDRPHLFSQGFAFKFEASDPTGLGFVLPHWLEPPEATFYLPAAALASANWVSGIGSAFAGTCPRARLFILPGSSALSHLALQPPGGVAQDSEGSGSSLKEPSGLDDNDFNTSVASSFFQIAPSSSSSVNSSSLSSLSSSSLCSSRCSPALASRWRTVLWLPLKDALLSGVGAERWRDPREGLAARLACLCPEELLFLRQLTRVSSCLRLCDPPVLLSVVEKRFVSLDSSGASEKAGAAEASEAEGRLCLPDQGKDAAYTVQRVRLISRRMPLTVEMETAEMKSEPERETAEASQASQGDTTHRVCEERREEDWILIRREFSVLVPTQSEDDTGSAGSVRKRKKGEMEKRRTEIVLGFPLLPSGHAAAPLYGLQTPSSFEFCPTPEGLSCVSSPPSSSCASSPSSASVSAPLPALPESRPVFCYLPVRSFGLPFVLHAPFDLTASRESLVVSSFFNLQLRNALPETFLAALKFCKHSALFSLQVSFLRFLPFFAAKENDFFGPAARDILRLLRRDPCLMVIDPATQTTLASFSSSSASSSVPSSSLSSPSSASQKVHGAAIGAFCVDAGEDADRCGSSRDSEVLPFTWAAPTLALLPSAALCTQWEPRRRGERPQARTFDVAPSSEEGTQAGRLDQARTVSAASSLSGGWSSQEAPVWIETSDSKCQGEDRAGSETTPPGGGCEAENGEKSRKGSDGKPVDSGVSARCGTTPDDLQARLVSPALLKKHLNLFYVHPEMLRETGDEALRLLGVRAFSLWDAVEFLRSVVAFHVRAKGSGGCEQNNGIEASVSLKGDRETGDSGSASGASRAAAGQGRAKPAAAKPDAPGGDAQGQVEVTEHSLVGEDEVLSPPWVGRFLCFLDELVEKGDYTKAEIHFAFETLKSIPFLPTSSGLRVAAGSRSASGRSPGVAGRDLTTGASKDEGRFLSRSVAPSEDSSLPLYVLVGEDGGHVPAAFVPHPGVPSLASRVLSPGANGPSGVAAETETAPPSIPETKPTKPAWEGPHGEKENRREALVCELGEKANGEAEMRQRTRRAVENLVRILSPDVFQPFRGLVKKTGHPNSFPEKAKEEEEERALRHFRALRSLNRLGVQEAGSLQLVSARVVPLLSDPEATRTLSNSTVVSLLAFLALHLDDVRTVLRSVGSKQRSRSAKQTAEKEPERDKGRVSGRPVLPGRGVAFTESARDGPGDGDVPRGGQGRRSAVPFPTDEAGVDQERAIWKSFQVLTTTGERVSLGDWRLRLPTSITSSPPQRAETRESGERVNTVLVTGEQKRRALSSLLLPASHAVELSPLYLDYAPVETWTAFFSFLGLTDILRVQTVVYELAWASPPSGKQLSSRKTQKATVPHEVKTSQEKPGEETDCLLSLRLLQVEDQVFAQRDYTCTMAVRSSPTFWYSPSPSVSPRTASTVSGEKHTEAGERDRNDVELSPRSLPLHILKLLVASRTVEEWRDLLAAWNACQSATCDVNSAAGSTKKQTKHRSELSLRPDLAPGMEDEEETFDRVAEGRETEHAAQGDKRTAERVGKPREADDAAPLFVKDFVSLDFENLCNALTHAGRSGTAPCGVSASPASCVVRPHPDAAGSDSRPSHGDSKTPEGDLRSRPQAEEERSRALVLADLVRQHWKTRIHPFLAATSLDTLTENQAYTANRSTSSPSSGFSVPEWPSTFLLQLRTRPWLPACEATTAAVATEFEEARDLEWGASEARGRGIGAGLGEASADSALLPEVGVVMDVDGETDSDSSLESNSDEEAAKGREARLQGRARKRRRGSGRSPRRHGALPVTLERPGSASLSKRPCLRSSGTTGPSATGGGATGAPHRGKRRRSGPRSLSLSSASLSDSSLSHQSSSEEETEGKEHRKRRRSAQASHRCGPTTGKPARCALGLAPLRWTYTGLAAPISLHVPSDRVFAVYGHLVRFLDPQCWQLWGDIRVRGEEAEEQAKAGAIRTRRAGREEQEPENEERKNEKDRGSDAKNRNLTEGNTAFHHSLSSRQDGYICGNPLACASPFSKSTASSLCSDPLSQFSLSSSLHPLAVLGVGTRPTVLGALALFHDLGRCLSCPWAAAETLVGSRGASDTRAALSGLLASSRFPRGCDSGRETAGRIQKVVERRKAALSTRGVSRAGNHDTVAKVDASDGRESAVRGLPSMPEFVLPPLPSLSLWHARGLRCALTHSCVESNEDLSRSMTPPADSCPRFSHSSPDFSLRSLTSTDPSLPAVSPAPSPPGAAFSEQGDKGRSVESTSPSKGSSELCWPCATMLDCVARLLLFLAEAANRAMEKGPRTVSWNLTVQDQVAAAARRPCVSAESSTSVATVEAEIGSLESTDLPALLRSCFQRDNGERPFLLLPLPPALLSSWRPTRDQSMPPQMSVGTWCSRISSHSPTSSCRLPPVSHSPSSFSSSCSSSSLSASGFVCGDAGGCLRWVGVSDVYWIGPPGVSEACFSSSSFFVFLTRTLLSLDSARHAATQTEGETRPEGQTRETTACVSASPSASPLAVAHLPQLFGAEVERAESIQTLRHLLVDTAGMPVGPPLQDCLDALLKLAAPEDEAERGAEDASETETSTCGECPRGRKSAEVERKRKTKTFKEAGRMMLVEEHSATSESASASWGLSEPSASLPLSTTSLAPLSRVPAPTDMSMESRMTQAALLLLYFACEVFKQERGRVRVSPVSSGTSGRAANAVASCARGGVMSLSLSGAEAQRRTRETRDLSGRYRGCSSSDEEMDKTREREREIKDRQQGSPHDCEERPGANGERAVGGDCRKDRQRREEKEATMRRLRVLLWDLPIIPTCVPAADSSQARGGNGGVSAPAFSKETAEETAVTSDESDEKERQDWRHSQHGHGLREPQQESDQAELEESVRWVAPRDGLSLVASERDAAIWKAFASLFKASSCSSRSPAASFTRERHGDESKAKTPGKREASPDALRGRLAWLPNSLVTLEQIVESEELANVCRILSSLPSGLFGVSAVSGVSSRNAGPSVQDVKVYLREEARLGVLRLHQSLSDLFPDLLALCSIPVEPSSSLSRPRAGAWPLSPSPSVWRQSRENPGLLPFRPLWMVFLREAFAARSFHAECTRQLSSSLTFLPECAAVSGETNLSSASPSQASSPHAFSPPLPLEALPLFLSPSLKRLLCCALLPAAHRYLYVRLPGLYRFLTTHKTRPGRACKTDGGADAKAESVFEGQGATTAGDSEGSRPRIVERLRRLKLFGTGDLGLRFLHRGTGVASRVQGRKTFLLGLRGSVEDEDEANNEGGKSRGDCRAASDSWEHSEDEDEVAFSCQAGTASSLPLLLAMSDAEHLRWFATPAAAHGVLDPGPNRDSHGRVGLQTERPAATASPARAGPAPLPFQLRFVALPPEFFREFSRLFSRRGEALEGLTTFLHLCYTVQLQCLLVKQLEGRDTCRSKRMHLSGPDAESLNLRSALAEELDRFLTAQGLPSLAEFQPSSEPPFPRNSDEREDSKPAVRQGARAEEGSNASETEVDYASLYSLHQEAMDFESDETLLLRDREKSATKAGPSDSFLWNDEWIREALREEDSHEYEQWRRAREGEGGNDEETDRKGTEEEESGGKKCPSVDDSCATACDKRGKRTRNSHAGAARTVEEGENEEEAHADDGEFYQTQRQEADPMGGDTSLERVNDANEESIVDEFFVTDLDRRTVPHIFGGLLAFGKEGMETEGTDPALSVKEHDALKQERDKTTEAISLLDDAGAGESVRTGEDAGQSCDSLQKRALEGENGEAERRDNIGVRDTLRVGAFTAEDLELPPGLGEAAPRRQLPFSEAVSTSKTDLTGRRGEHIVFSFLSIQFKDEIKDGRCRVLWVNEDEESGTPYDILVTKYGRVGSSTPPESIYIEVKSTSSQSKSFFEVSHKEWQFAQQHGDQFHIYRVLDVGSEQPRILRIVNPYRQWRENRIGICIAL